MKSLFGQYRSLFLALTTAALLVAARASANGPIGEHVNHLQDNFGHYEEEVNWLIDKVDGIVNTYARDGAKAAHPEAVVDHWEAVDFHAAIETNYVPIYASIWQGLYGVRLAVENGEPLASVREQQSLLERALWQALGAVKLAAQFQQKGLLAEVEHTVATTPTATLDEVKTSLDRVVAKYAERLPEEATGIVHDTYLTRFEGVEGDLITQDASLVEDLEKDFNVTLPVAIKNNASVDDVREVVRAMHDKLDRAKALLEEAEKNRKDVF